MSVSPDGLYAAVGHSSQVSYVRSPPAVEKVIPTTANVFDVVLAGNGWICAFPRDRSVGGDRCLRISTGTETLSTGYSIYAETKAKLHPAGAAIYGAGTSGSPLDIEKYDVSTGTAKYLYNVAVPMRRLRDVRRPLDVEDGLRIFHGLRERSANTTRERPPAPT